MKVIEYKNTPQEVQSIPIYPEVRKTIEKQLLHDSIIFETYLRVKHKRKWYRVYKFGKIDILFTNQLIQEELILKGLLNFHKKCYEAIYLTEIESLKILQNTFTKQYYCKLDPDQSKEKERLLSI